MNVINLPPTAPASADAASWRASWKNALDAVQLDLDDVEHLLDQLHSDAAARTDAAEKLAVRTASFAQIDGSLGPMPADFADRARMLLIRQREVSGDLARAMTVNRRHARVAAAMQHRPAAAVPVYIDTEA